MSASARIEVVGVKDTINQLGKIDKELQKEFKASATQVAQPAIDAAKNMYTQVPLSGVSRDWTQKKDGRKIKGFSVAKAKAGVQMKFDTRRRAVGVILIIQKDVAAAVFETAGRKTSNKLGKSLGSIDSGKTRLLQPAVDGARDKIEKEMKQLIKDVTQTVQRGM
jgi:hypothetical protein